MSNFFRLRLKLTTHPQLGGGSGTSSIVDGLKKSVSPTPTNDKYQVMFPLTCSLLTLTQPPSVFTHHICVKICQFLLFCFKFQSSTAHSLFSVVTHV